MMKKMISKPIEMMSDLLEKIHIYITTRPVAVQPVMVRQHKRSTRLR